MKFYYFCGMKVNEGKVGIYMFIFFKRKRKTKNIIYIDAFSIKQSLSII